MRNTWTIDIVLPDMPTVSELNKHEHWRKRWKRSQRQRHTTRLVLMQERAQYTPPRTPLVITLTRISPRKLDDGDNLNSSMKHIRDGVADWLRLDDGHPLLRWEYRQEKGAPRERAVRIEVRPG